MIEWKLLMRAAAAMAMIAGAAQLRAAEDALGWGHRATIAAMKAPPTPDGRLEPGEWDHATGTVNFMNTFGKLTADFEGMHMDLREGRTLVGYHGNTLYLAVVSALPPRAWYEGGKHSQTLGRDAELIGDFNAIEIWLDPNRDRRESREGDQAFYQVFVNSVGSVYDARLVPGSAPDKGWNTDIQSAHHIDEANKIWTAEIAIDMSNFPGWDKPVAGGSMGMLIARNYKAIWNQATWFPHGGAFVSWQLYPRVYFTQEGVVARIDDLGAEFWKARPNFDVTLFNPGPARTAKVRLRIESSTMPEVLDEQVVALPAQGSGSYRFGLQGERLHDHADHKFNLQVTPEGTAEATFNYTGMWSGNPRVFWGSGAAGRFVRRADRLPFEQKWGFRAEANPGASVGIIAYPYQNLLRVTLKADALVADPTGADKDKLSDSAEVTVAREGVELSKERLSWDLEAGSYGLTHDFKLEKLEAGEYVVTATFNRHADPIRAKYTREVYEWEHNTVGITDTIYPPFEAVVADARSTKVVLRDYGVGDLGLWNSVKSLGREILAAPIVLKADGERVLTGTARLVEGKPMLARYEAQAEDEAVNVTAVATTEIDGVMKLELTLKPGTRRQELRSLVLDIPLKAEQVPLFHAVTTAVRVNPMGELPGGEGVVWDNNRFPNGDWPVPFVPYLWLGGGERGLCVFANNDKGWVRAHDGKRNFKPAQEIIRRGDTVVIRLNLVQEPITLDEPRTITLGLMASPGKPIPYKDWRAIAAWGSSLGEGFEWMPRHVFTMGFAVETVFNAAYPYGRDYSINDARARIAGTPGGDLAIEKGYGAFLADWKRRHGMDKPKEELTPSQTYALQRASQHPGTENYNAMYWDEYHSDHHGHPETKVFNGEWRSNMAQSRRDFRCWYGNETVKRGVGLYFDNTFPHRQRDPLIGDAYEVPGFGMQPSAGLWEQRDYHRRIWNIHRAHGRRWNDKPMQMIHMTNASFIPMLTWNDMNVDLEWFYGPEPQQSKYGLAMMLAETAGRQAGCVPFALANIENTRSASERRIAERTKFGTMMVHEVRFSYSGVPEAARLGRILHGFGYGRAGVFPEEADREAVYNYWQDDYPVASDQDLVKTLLVRRDDELMLLAVSWDQNPLTTRFTFDTGALDVKVSEASDAEGTAAEQLAECRERIAEAEAGLAKSREDLARTEAVLAEKPDSANHLKAKARQVLQITREESRIAGMQGLLAEIESAASKRIAYDAAKRTLTVDMEGYGVRMIRLK